MPYIKSLGITSEQEGYKIEVLVHGLVELVKRLLPATTAEQCQCPGQIWVRVSRQIKNST